MRPLLQRTVLWPNESLASVLERLRHLNFYVHRRQLTKIGRERLKALNIEDKLDRPTQLETFQQLACLTHLTLDELYAASDQRFAEGTEPLGQTSEPMPWLENTLRPRLDLLWAHEHLRSHEAVSFCPLCLKDAAYQRLSWIPRAAAICLEHRCVLRDRCSRCWAKPTVADLVNRRCPKCKADLSRMRSVSIAQDSLGFQSQQFIQAWFNVADISGEVLEAGHLPPQPPMVLYRLLHLLARALLHGQAEWSTLPYPLDGLANRSAATISAQKHLTSEQAYVLYRSAFAGLLDWPQGLYRLLDVYAGYDDLKTSTPPRLRYVQRLQRDWLTADWAASPLAFVQRDLLDYILKRDLPLTPKVVKQFQDVPWFIAQTGLWTEERTAQCLDLSLADLYRLTWRSSLAECYWPQSPRHLPRFKQAAVLALKQRWAIGWSLKDVCSWLGLEASDVWRLVDLGLLSATGERNEADEDRSMFNPQAVRDFFTQIVTRLEPYPESRRDLIPLVKAVDKVNYLGVDCAVLLQRVLTGLLPAYHCGTEIASLYHVYVIHSTIFDLPEQIYAARGWVFGHRFADEYGFAPSLIRQWLAANLIQPAISFGCCHYFDLQQLKDLAAEHGFISPIIPPARKR
jgi:hypothetical protein